ncbi:MAG TPA: potassium-transporting ATPase subunit KdpC [Nakamurella sp.]|nr:potassium-transporting ATPase subunit KdpC [Nakamurella sp.]
MTATQSLAERPEPQQPATTPRPSAATLVSIGGRQALVALRVLLAMTLILGIAYPLVVLGVGQLAANNAANSSLVTDSSGTVVGSELIGQQFDGPQWFAGRPSAAGDGYDAMSSGGSNLAADSPDLLAEVQDRRAQIAADNGVDPSAVPPDALTASGSGLDPNISPAYALLQVNRIADARGLPVDQVRDLVQAHIQGRTLGFIGEERVNVLALNMALHQLAPAGDSTG